MPAEVESVMDVHAKDPREDSEDCIGAPVWASLGSSRPGSS